MLQDSLNLFSSSVVGDDQFVVLGTTHLLEL